MLDRGWLRPIARAVAVTALANLAFLILLIAGQGADEAVAARVRAAFAAGDLGTVDFLAFDWRHGWLQYNDCTVLQMLTNRHRSRLLGALAPRVFYENDDWRNQCAVLRALVVDGRDPATLHVLHYSRYWHGYNALTSFALRWMDLRGLRRVLSGIVWMAIGMLGLAACRSGGHRRRAGLAIAVAAGTVWAVPYFSPGLTGGPGDAALVLALVPIVAWPRTTARLGFIVPYAAGFGAVVVFLEMLTGQLPVAVAWLAAVTLAAARDRAEPAGDVAPVVLALSAANAFCLGAISTVIAKQILSITLAEPRAGADFLDQLEFYMRAPSGYATGHGLVASFARLARASNVLAFGSRWAGYGLLLGTGLAWLAAATRARGADRARALDLLLLLGAALAPVAWVIMLPQHAYIHASFMVRILIVPISLAPLVLSWPLARPARGSPRAG